jgi:hypothetical protein
MIILFQDFIDFVLLSCFLMAVLTNPLFYDVTSHQTGMSKGRRMILTTVQAQLAEQAPAMPMPSDHTET